MAVKATFALKAGVWFRRVRFVMISPDSQQPSPLSGRKSTYQPCPDSPSQLCEQLLQAAQREDEVRVEVATIQMERVSKAEGPF
jgi:hypothetical protein